MNRMALLVASALVLAFATATMMAPARAAEPLSPEQKAAVEQVIHDYLLKNPEFMVEVLNAAESKYKQKKVDQIRVAIAAKRQELVADKASPVGGNPDGDVTIVEFFDYRCPYCKQVEPALESLLKADPKLRIVYKEFPVLGDESVFASHMALAALKQGKYTAFHDAMMAVKGQVTREVTLMVAAQAGVDLARAKADMDSPDVKQLIQRNYDLAEALDINGTPAFIIGDLLIPGAIDIDGLKKLVADARKSG